MTDTIAQIINAALEELSQSGVIDKPSEDSEEIASCIVETGPGGTPIMVTFRDWLVFVELRDDEYVAYFSVERERVTA